MDDPTSPSTATPRRRTRRAVLAAPGPTRPLSDTEAARAAELDAIVASLDELRSGVRSATLDPASTPWPLFARTMRCLNPQSWGPRMEAYLRESHGWSKVHASSRRGDALCEHRHHELKCSMITASNRQANFVQIRPAHDIEGYHLFVVEADYTVVHHRLTTPQMATEIERCGQLAHGTRSSGVAATPDAEFAVRVSWEGGDEHRERWRSYEVSRGAPGGICCAPMHQSSANSTPPGTVPV